LEEFGECETDTDVPREISFDVVFFGPSVTVETSVSTAPVRGQGVKAGGEDVGEDPFLEAGPNGNLGNGQV
jgi:hypothetical protein